MAAGAAGGLCGHQQLRRLLECGGYRKPCARPCAAGFGRCHRGPHRLGGRAHHGAGATVGAVLVRLALWRPRFLQCGRRSRPDPGRQSAVRATADGGRLQPRVLLFAFSVAAGAGSASHPHDVRLRRGPQGHRHRGPDADRQPRAGPQPAHAGAAARSGDAAAGSGTGDDRAHGGTEPAAARERRSGGTRPDGSGTGERNRPAAGIAAHCRGDQPVHPAPERICAPAKALYRRCRAPDPHPARGAGGAAGVCRAGGR